MNVTLDGEVIQTYKLTQHLKISIKDHCTAELLIHYLWIYNAAESEIVYLRWKISSQKNKSKLYRYLDRGFLFGDGVYELIPMSIIKRFFTLNDHLSRT